MTRILTLAALSALIAMPAWAQQQCGSRDKLIAGLSSKYLETPVAAAATSDGKLLEVLATDNGSTWTIVVTAANGWACVVAAGEGWRAKEQIAEGPEA